MSSKHDTIYLCEAFLGYVKVFAVLLGGGKGFGFTGVCCYWRGGHDFDCPEVEVRCSATGRASDQAHCRESVDSSSPSGNVP